MFVPTERKRDRCNDHLSLFSNHQLLRFLLLNVIMNIIVITTVISLRRINWSLVHFLVQVSIVNRFERTLAKGVEQDDKGRNWSHCMHCIRRNCYHRRRAHFTYIIANQQFPRAEEKVIRLLFRVVVMRRFKISKNKRNSKYEKRPVDYIEMNQVLIYPSGAPGWAAASQVGLTISWHQNSIA